MNNPTKVAGERLKPADGQSNAAALPPAPRMYRALADRDGSFEGIFVAGVKTTGIFCRPACTAKMPKPENIEYFRSPREALLRGYRPCKICRPLGRKGEFPDWLKPLIDEIDADPSGRLRDGDLRARGLEPSRVRRWFLKNHGLTFQAYLRSLRIGKAFQEKVWTVLRSIPYGTTRSYQEQARILGDPRAIRAVARANGDNRLAILVPCHRVIGKNGKLVGYGGGLWRKQYLLNFERKNK